MNHLSLFFPNVYILIQDTYIKISFSYTKIGEDMKKVHLRKKYIYHKPRFFKYKWLWILLFICIFIYVIFTTFNHQLTPILMKHAEAEIKKVSLYMVNESIDDEVINRLNMEELFIMNKVGNTIQSVDFNTLKANQLLQDINKKVWMNLSALQNGNINILSEHDSIFQNYEKSKLQKGVVYEVPMGVVFNNTLLSTTGPKIPVKLVFSGNMNSYVKTNIKDYGINNAIIEVTIHIEVEEQILLPFTSKKIMVETDVPLAVKIIEGSVPNYYSTGIKENSPIISSSS